jgi:hypothetical protein
MGPYSKRGDINSGGKNIKYGQEILKLLDAMWPLNRWWLYTAEGNRKEMQQLPREARKLTKRPNKWPSQRSQPQLF